MFGGIAAAGGDRLWYAAFDGTVVLCDVERADLAGQFTLFPTGPARVHVSACAVAPDGSLLLADVHNGRVRRFSAEGEQVVLIGGMPAPGIDDQDDPGVVAEPCALLVDGDTVLVASGAFGVAHGVQRFGLADGAYRASLPAPAGGWRRAQGLARIEDTLWIAETEAGAIRRRAPAGDVLDDVDLHPDLRRPFRLTADGYGAVLMLLAPDRPAQQELFGVARLDADGAFAGWAVRAGEDAGGVYCPFDVAVLPDGRFAVADLPLGEPPEVRVQLFTADGRLVRVLIEDTADLRARQHEYLTGLLDAGTPYEQARVHHLYSGGSPEHLARAAELYREAIEARPDHRLAALGLGELLHRAVGDHRPAEQAYRMALAAGAPKGATLARVAECRHDEGDLDGAIAILEEAIGADPPPEDYHDRVETLGTYYLERSGETPKAVE
jgi:tetratricopeptide (TPR) repeat protein